MENFIEITSKDNLIIKSTVSLQTSSKARREEGFFVLEGLRICKDAMDNNIEFEKLIITENAFNKHTADIKKFQKISKKSYVIPESLFKKIGNTENPQGIIAIAKIPKINAKISAKGRYIALENISDPSNLGAIARTAEALGIDGIILTTNGCDPYSPKSLRSSMGTLLRMPLFITDNIAEFIKFNNLLSFACVVDSDAEDITNIDFVDGCVAIIGNEANGLITETKNSAYKRITIHMNGSAESLNAAAASAIVMWEMNRAR